MAHLGFTWIRLSGTDDDLSLHPGMYVHAAEVVAYLREHDPAEVADALERLQADNPPATTSGWVR